MTFVCYDGGPQDHDSNDRIEWNVMQFRLQGITIPDTTAQAIASWWHTPSRQWTAGLSTGGVVTFETLIEDFADDSEYESCGWFDQQCLDALKDYIETKQRESRKDYPHEFGRWHECNACEAGPCVCENSDQECASHDCFNGEW